MEISIGSFGKNRFIKSNLKNLFAILVLHLFLGTMHLSAQESTSQFIQGADTLVVYKDVPGQISSDKYTIRVKSSLTNDQWVDVFAHYTYNRAGELPLDGLGKSITNFHYQWFTDKWSHTYGNIELSKNTPVEVEIAFKSPTFTIAGQPIFKAAAHPSTKVSKQPEVENCRIYFTIDKPGQITIDINGQMDDYHAAINPIGKPVHAISLFANPILSKPSLTGSRTYFIEANADTAITRHLNPVLFDTLYFKPGVHKMGINFKLHPGKKYYIPGDAIVYGTFNNMEMPLVGNLRSGEDIKMYGYGTISCQGIHHPNYVTGADPDHYSPIFITDAMNVETFGLTLADPSMHSLKLQVWPQRPDIMKKETICKWIKVISWRANGDGIGSAQLVEDCFLRTADDASYMKGDRIRNIFWRDVHAAGFHMAGTPGANESFPLIIEDCDVIYHRSRDVVGSNGGIFHNRAEGIVGQHSVNVTVRNFRSEDKLANSPFFNMFSKNGTNIGSSYSGITFQNISIASNKIKQVLTGCVEAPWDGGITFDNLTIDGTLITQSNFISYFTTNEFTKNIIFKNSTNYTLTLNNSENGTIVPGSSLPNFVEGSIVTLTAVPKSGYDFVSWSGDATGTTNPINITMTKNMIVSAVFQKATSFVFETPGTGSWIVPPGINSISIKAWGAGGAGGSANSGTATVNTQARTGGGAGGSFAGVTLSVNPGQVVNFTIGAGGLGALAGFVHQTKGESGGTTFATLNNATVISALGGTGGENVSITNLIYSGIGGVVSTTGNIGDTIYFGGNGGNAGQGTGGGGGSAGAEGNGGNGGTITAGVAGSGGGAAGGIGTNLGATVPTAGNAPGAGGAGAIVRNNTPFSENNMHRTGAKGAAGKLIISTNVSSALLTPSDNHISIYPNPATDKLYLKSYGLLINKIQLIDLTGKIVHSANVKLQNGSVDLSGIGKGMYLVKIHTDNNIFTKKISLK